MIRVQCFSDRSLTRLWVFLTNGHGASSEAGVNKVVKFIRLLLVVFSSQYYVTEGVITTRSNRMKFRLRRLSFFFNYSLNFIRLLRVLRASLEPLCGFGGQ